jgi:RNA polymerase sigma-54 factor
LDLSFGSEQRLLQKISPAMFQSLNILRLNVTDLRELVIGESEKNPAVELVEHKNLPHGSHGDTFSDIKAEQSMEEYILEQVPEWSDGEKDILLTLLKNLDEKGFFAGNVGAIAAEHGIAIEVVAHILGELKTLRPWGIGAENLPEALLIQLKNIAGLGGSARAQAERIIAAHLDDLLRGSLKKIAKRESMELGDVEAIAKLVSRLRFTPLSFFEHDIAQTIIPDIKFFMRNGEWLVEVDDSYCPQFRLSDTYKNLLAGHGDAEAIKYLKEQAKSARLLTRAILRRKETLGKIAQSILERQMPFFAYGPKWLKRLSMREIAEDISMNISTVCRAIADKYAQTPHGMFKLAAFFESGVDDCSATFIKNEMKRLMGSATGQLSDQKISHILRGRGISVSRRTIAKYRKQMNLPNSRIRKIH